jgi:hypothetical protein
MQGVRGMERRGRRAEEKTRKVNEWCCHAQKAFSGY